MEDGTKQLIHRARVYPRPAPARGLQKNSPQNPRGLRGAGIKAMGETRRWGLEWHANLQVRGSGEHVVARSHGRTPEDCRLLHEVGAVIYNLHCYASENCILSCLPELSLLSGYS